MNTGGSQPSASRGAFSGADVELVELDRDHPGFNDEIYRRRRNEIAALAQSYVAGGPLPSAEYNATEQEVWRRLSRSFAQAAATPDPPALRDIGGRPFWEVRMLIYWSGAAIFMLADLELRQRSEGRQSLDNTLRGFERCCLPSRHIWSAREVMNKLDEISGTSVFSEMYDTHVLSDRFPDTRVAFNALGLNPVGRNELQLSRDREETALRRAIMGPRP